MQIDAGSQPESKFLLSAVIPISRMAGRLENFESWIYQAVNSGKVELVLVHDIQDDETKIQLDRIVSKFKNRNTQLLEGYFGNPGAARNYGSKHCNGLWITYWDSDDIPLWENVIMAIQNAGPAEVLIGEFNLVYLDKSSVRIRLRENVIDSIIEYPGIWRMVFHHSLLARTRFPELRMGEDQVMLAGLDLFSQKLKTFRTEFYNYQTGSNYQLTKNRKAIQDLSKAMNLTWRIARKQDKQNSVLSTSLFCSQLITAFKKGTFMTRLTAFKFALTGMFEGKRQSAPQLLPTLAHVIKIKNAKLK
jgi:hypothetical protein